MNTINKSGTNVLLLEERRKLLFNCRRGNSETELLLMPFVDRLMSAEDIKQFRELLNSNDSELLSWLMHPKQASKKNQKLIHRIRHHYLKINRSF